MQNESHFGRHAKERVPNYSRVPNDLIRNNKLSCEARVFILWAASHDSSFVWTRKQAMEAMCVKSLTTFYRIIDELCESKYLIKADLIKSTTAPASKIYLIYKVPYDSMEYSQWYEDDDINTSKQLGVPEFGTTPYQNLVPPPVPKNGTLKNTNNKEKQLENNISARKVKKGFVPPTEEEVKAFFQENKYTEEIAIKAFHHYAGNDWCDTYGNKVLNWKSKMRNNWFKDQYKIQEGTFKVRDTFGSVHFKTQQEIDRAEKGYFNKI